MITTNNRFYEEREEDFELDPQYLRMKKKIIKQRGNLRIQSFMLKLCVMIIIALSAVNLINIRITDSMNDQIISMKTSYDSLEKEHNELLNQFDYVSNLLTEVSDIAVQLDEDNQTLLSTIEEQKQTISSYEEREELFDKYEYAIIRKENGSRTDITYDNIRTLENLSQEKGLNEEAVDLVLSLAMVESGGTEKARNNSSSAKGYGQILSSTGQFVYTKLMGNSSYNHELALDGETNLTMTMELVNYLDEKFKGNWNIAINSYRGEYDDSYRKKVNRYLSYSNLSLSSLKLR